MRTQRTSLVLRLVGLMLLATALAGCTSAPRYEKGEVLSTEQQNAQRVPEFRIQAAGHMDRTPPTLAVWMESRNKVTAEERDVCQKVQVTGHRRISFEPTFFLWPWNVARTPVGLVGCVFSATDVGLHYAAGAVGGVMGVAGSIFVGMARAPGGLLSSTKIDDPTGFGMAGDIAAVFMFVLETPLLVLDVPHRFIHGTQYYPMAMNRKNFPKDWGRSISRSWDYAWNYQVYPPFIIWMRTDSAHGDVPGETITGDWVQREHYEEWADADAGSVTLESGGQTRTVSTLGGVASIDLRELAAGLGPADILRLTVKVQTTQGPVSRDFSSQVADLLTAP